MGSYFAWIWMWFGLGLNWRMLFVFTWETSLAVEIALQGEISLEETKKEAYPKTHRKKVQLRIAKVALGLSWRMLSVFTWETSLAVEIALQSEIPFDETKKESYSKTHRRKAPRHTTIDPKTSYQSYARLRVMVDQFQHEKLRKSD
ncbi:hypothetical protein Ancab_026370 [Ancistrocladus abbreviatus]